MGIVELVLFTAFFGIILAVSIAVIKKTFRGAK